MAAGGRAEKNICAHGLGTDLATIKRLCRDDAEAVNLLALVAEPQAEQEYGKGKPGPGRGHKTDDNISRFIYGTDPDYLTARIARDRPDILDRMKAGEFRSVRAAAIEAGIVKAPTPLARLQRAWRTASSGERAEFLHWIESDQ